MTDINRTIDNKELENLVIFEGQEVDLRRDLNVFIAYVKNKGIKRTSRENLIPKSASRQLAKLLSFSRESDLVESDGNGHWSDYVSHFARELGLLTFDMEGKFIGYTSSAPTFSENYIEIKQQNYENWLKNSPLKKEKSFLDVLIKTTNNEFFFHSHLIEGYRFDSMWREDGPDKKMKLPIIRKKLIEIFTKLEPGLWYDFEYVIKKVQEEEPHLILDPKNRDYSDEYKTKLREWNWEYGKNPINFRYRKVRKIELKNGKVPPKPEPTYKDIYANFSELKPGESRWNRKAAKQLVSTQSDGFQRVEGRYLQFFLEEIPYIMGFVSLAYRSDSDNYGLDVVPPYGRLRAVRFSDRFFQIMKKDPLFNEVTVKCLPTFEVIVHAPSYPDQIIQQLESIAVLRKEDGPIHRFRLDRKKVQSRTANHPNAPSSITVLKELCDDSIPENVVTELESWSSFGEKVTIFENCALLELLGEDNQKKEIFQKVRSSIEVKINKNIAVVNNPDKLFRKLDKNEQVPIKINHSKNEFTSLPEIKGSTFKTARKSTVKPAGKNDKKKLDKLKLQPLDVVAYRGKSSATLKAFYKVIQEKISTCSLVDNKNGTDAILIVPAGELPRFRTLLRSLPDRFEVEIAG